MSKRILVAAPLVVLLATAAVAVAQVGELSLNKSEIATSTLSVKIEESVVFSPQEVSALEDAYFARFGRYLQIMPGNRLPKYPSASVADALGVNLPADMRVDVYENPTGIGYQISYDSLGVRYSVGYGPEAASRTYSYQLPTLASTTSTSSLPRLQ